MSDPVTYYMLWQLLRYGNVLPNSDLEPEEEDIDNEKILKDGNDDKQNVRSD